MPKGYKRSLRQGADPHLQGIIILDLPVKNRTMTITGATGDGWGTVKLADFPEGNVLCLGAVAYLQFAGTGSDGDLSDTWEGDYALGSTAIVDATIETTGADLIDLAPIAPATDEVSPISRGAGATTVMLDNSLFGAAAINLNMKIDDLDIAGDDTVITVNGNMQLIYSVEKSLTALPVEAGPPTDAQAIIDAMDPAPDGPRQTIIEDTVAALKTAGFWDRLDLLAFFAAHDTQAATLNWKAPDGQAIVPVGAPSPVFTADEGYAGDGTQSYLDPVTPLDDVSYVNYTQDAASYGVFLRELNTTGAFDALFGTTTGTSTQLFYANAPLTELDWQMNGGATQFVDPTPDTTGLMVVNRDSSTTKQLYIDGALKDSAAGVSSVTVPTTPAYILARLNAGSPGLFGPMQASMVFAGDSFDATEQSDLSDIIAAYLTSVGALP